MNLKGFEAEEIGGGGGKGGNSATSCYESCIPSLLWDCLVGLVIKVSASRAEDPGFESHLHWDFFGVESYQ